MVSNGNMRYIADPFLEDPGIASPDPPAAGNSGKARDDNPRDDSRAGSFDRKSVLQTLRGSLDGGGSGNKVKVSAWKGVAGDDHVPGKVASHVSGIGTWHVH